VTLGRPAYAGLRFASGVLMILAVLGYIAGPIAIVVGVAESSTMETRDEGRLSLLAGVAILIGAAVQHGLSAACSAVRDIARNSWRLREIENHLRASTGGNDGHGEGAAMGHPPAGHPADQEKPQAVERCANCGAKIGPQETPFVLNNNVVCAACHRRLATANLPEPIPPAPSK